MKRIRKNGLITYGIESPFGRIVPMEDGLPWQVGSNGMTMFSRTRTSPPGVRVRPQAWYDEAELREWSASEGSRHIRNALAAAAIKERDLKRSQNVGKLRR
jgi:hypothetical protein